MKKTLLLVFIHGFKGGDNTFEDFPRHLGALVEKALPKINVLPLVYPKFETRGDLHDTVARFKDWLQNKVIDLEVAANTPSPTVDPAVRVILIGHSMGGIVAAETLLSISQDLPIPAQTFSTPPPGVGNNTTTSASASTTNLHPPQADASARASSAPPQSNNDEPSDAPLFPHIQAVLAFDTPYLGIHPGVVAHGAETHYNTASAAYQAYSTAQKFFGTGTSSTATPIPSSSAGALPAAGGSGWGKWSKYAMFAGGAAAAVAAGAGVWMNKEQISEGWGWAFSHLEFIGCLAKGAELTQRIEKIVAMDESHGVGFAEFYTALGNDKTGQTKYSAQFLGEQRTFCVVPEKKPKDKLKTANKERGDSPSPGKKRKVAPADAADISKGGKKATGERGTWIRCTNAKAKSEISAHMNMFTPAENPDYVAMGEKARKFVEGWVDMEWYAGSGEETKKQEQAEERVKSQGREDERKDEEVREGANKAEEAEAVEVEGKSEAKSVEPKSEIGDVDDMAMEGDGPAGVPLPLPVEKDEL